MISLHYKMAALYPLHMQYCLGWLQARTFKKVLILCCSLHFNQSVGRNKWPILPIKTFQVQDLIKRAILYNDVPNYIYYFLYFLVHSFMLALLCKSLNGHPEKAAKDCSPFRWSRNYKLLYWDYFLLQITYLKDTFVPYYPYFNIHKHNIKLRVRSDFRRVNW